LKVREARVETEESDGKMKGQLLPVLVVALVLALFTGTVWLVADGVSSFGGDIGRNAGESASVMKRVGALVKCTRVINEPLPLAGSRSYDFLGNIDGDAGTGLFGAPGYGKGLERVVIYRAARRSRELKVDVYNAPGQSPRSTVLTGDLDSNNPLAFRVDCTYESSTPKSRLHEYPVRVRVSLVLSPRAGETAGSRRAGEVFRITAQVPETSPSGFLKDIFHSLKTHIGG
jgi:hypothetical protein